MTTYVDLPDITVGADFRNIPLQDAEAKVDVKLNSENATEVDQNAIVRVLFGIVIGFPLLFGWITFVFGILGMGSGIATALALLFGYYPLALISLGFYFMSNDNTACPYSNIPTLLFIGGIISLLLVIGLITVLLKREKNLEAIRRFMFCIFLCYWVFVGPYVIYAFFLNADYVNGTSDNLKKCQLVFYNSPFLIALVGIPGSVLLTVFIVMAVSFVLLWVAKAAGNTEAKQILSQKKKTKVPVPMPTV